MKHHYHQLVIENGHPIPMYKGIFTELVKMMRVGQSVELHEMHRSSITTAANRNNIPILTKKTKLGHFRFWVVTREVWEARGWGRAADFIPTAFEIVESEPLPDDADGDRQLRAA